MNLSVAVLPITESFAKADKMNFGAKPGYKLVSFAKNFLIEFI